MSKIGIGFRFTYNNKDGVVLQTCNKLPKHHNRENEVGPFYGVHYEGGIYNWYNEVELLNLQNKNE